MYRELRTDLYWLQECGPDRRHFVTESDRESTWYTEGAELHVPQNAYLFVDEETALFDTLSPASTDQILGYLDEILGDRPLDYLIVSHPDVPHAGNAMPILKQYPEATLVAPTYGVGHELYHLEESSALHVGEGDSLSLGQQTLAFHEATFPDAAVHMWMTEETSNILFPVDWLGYPHMETECLACDDELDTAITRNRLVEFHGRVLFWYQYVDVAKTNREIDRLIETYDPDGIAPAHGNVIRENPVEVMESMKEVVDRIATLDRVGTLG